jgi:L-amino acid N-acyltransferase YncA
MLVRDATVDDAAACAAIYAPYVTGSAITFEHDPPDAAAMAERIAAAQRSHAWLVAERGGTVVGYAYAGPWKARPAYRWSTEVTVYVAVEAHRAGVGRALYEALFERLAARGYRTLVGGITLPNDASVGVHRALGFEPVGTFPRIGWKLGEWRDVHYLVKHLGPDADEADRPAEPR